MKNSQNIYIPETHKKYNVLPNHKKYNEEIGEWIKKYPEIKKEILDYKNSIIKLNNKDNWAIVQYIGNSNYSFTNNNFYYVVMYKENDCWKVYGIVDNEEYDAFVVWKNKCTDHVDLLKDLKIVIDPSNILKEEFIRIMK